jgi:ferredoxin
MHKVTYFQDVTVEVPDGQTKLDASIRNRILHHHQCGAQVRCTTCRIQILDGISHVCARSLFEEQIASTRGWDKIHSTGVPNESSWRRGGITVYGTIAETMINAAKYREERAGRVSRN